MVPIPHVPSVCYLGGRCSGFVGPLLARARARASAVAAAIGRSVGSDPPPEARQRAARRAIGGFVGRWAASWPRRARGRSEGGGVTNRVRVTNRRARGFVVLEPRNAIRAHTPIPVHASTPPLRSPANTSFRIGTMLRAGTTPQIRGVDPEIPCRHWRNSWDHAKRPNSPSFTPLPSSSQLQIQTPTAARGPHEVAAPTTPHEPRFDEKNSSHSAT